MGNESKSTRKGSPPIKVYCLPEERKQIEANAKAAGLSMSAYLLNVGMGYQVTGIVDYQHVPNWHGSMATLAVLVVF